MPKPGAVSSPDQSARLHGPFYHQVDGVEGFVVLTFTVLVSELGGACHRRQAVHLHCEVVSFSAIERITDCDVERAWLCWQSEELVLIMPHL